MIDEFAKEYLHDDLRWIREAVLWKLDGLSEYGIRRPLRLTGTPDTPTSCANSSTARSGPIRRARPGRNTTRLTLRTTARRSSRPPKQLIPPAPECL